MGIIDFARDVGEKLGVGKSGPDAATREYMDEATKANALFHRVQDLGIRIEELTVDFDDGVAVLSGRASSQEAREKAVLAVGNVEGVTKVDDRIEVDSPAHEATFYTVQKGDTLSAIAKAHYGNAGAYPRIFEANRPMLKDPDLIYPGQVLRIPPNE